MKKEKCSKKAFIKAFSHCMSFAEIFFRKNTLNYGKYNNKSKKPTAVL